VISTDPPAAAKDPGLKHLREIDHAIEWLGLKQGRLVEYRRIYKEFLDGARGREHIFSYNESIEITETVGLWENRVDEFPGLFRKLRHAFRKGPILREQETRSSERPRNDTFVYYLAGRLLAAGVDVTSVDGIAARSVATVSSADISVTVGGEDIDIECKRPRSVEAVGSRSDKAEKQIKQRRDRVGAIAIDCSVIIRPDDKLLSTVSPRGVGDFVNDALGRDAVEVIRRSYERRDLRILGVILFARVPVIETVPSRILQMTGEPFVDHYQRHSVCGYSCLNYHSSAKPGTFSTLHRLLAANTRSTRTR